jgi:DNA-binding response OmpR family regulator
MKSPSVLIIDDSKTILMGLAEAFQSGGFRTVLCETVSLARAVLSEDTFELIILDLLLPDSNGIDFLKELKAVPRTRDVPVVLLSSEADVEVRVRAIENGAADYVRKTCDNARIVARAKSILRQTDSHVAALKDLRAKVLVIDDSRTFREAMKEALQMAGYAVVTAASGEEGLCAAADIRPDAIVVDALMPGIDGPSVIRRVRMDTVLRQIPCVLLTASDDRREELRALDSGADAFVTKEEDLGIILARLAAVIRSAHRLEGDSISSLSSPKRILAIDDSLTFLQKLTEHLHHAGCDVVLASSGEQALQLLAVQSVDCILLDLCMPGLSGTEVCRRIKSTEGWGHIPLIMLTSEDDKDAVIEAINAGADDYIVKSSDFEILQARLLALLRRKQLEDEQREIREKYLQKELETAEARAQLLQAQKMESIGQLAGGIAHDFNNFLSVILGYSDFVTTGLGNGTSSDSLRADVDEIKNAALRAASLTRQLLAFSRRQVLEPAVINLNFSVSGMEKMCRRLIGEDIDLETALDPELGRAKADPGQVEQVIMNLVVNARDAMPNGGKLTIGTANCLLDQSAFPGARFPVRPGPCVMLYVSDTGNGMTPEVKERIFEPFFTTKEKGKGTGLGLATVFGVVKQSGGYVWVDSDPGRGATFKIYLPRVEDDVEAPVTPIPSAVPSSGSETILVVEDDEKIRSMMKRFLETKTYRVLEAANGNEAMALCDKFKNPIHLVITDIIMPGINGLEFVDRLRSSRPSVTALYMSGYTDHAIYRQEIPALKANFLMKPFTSEVLTNKVREVLDRPAEPEAKDSTGR